jgi:Uma2 family endonuclease
MTQNYPILIGKMNADDFDRFAARPENVGRALEFVAGEVHEAGLNVYAAIVASRMSRRMSLWTSENHGGTVSSHGTRYSIGDDRFVPAAAYTGLGKAMQQTHDQPHAPDVAVEVDYPSDAASQRRLRIKVHAYAAAGAVAWLIFPETMTVEVYEAGKPARVLAEADVLDGGDALPGFSVSVKEIFPPLPDDGAADL